MRWPLITFFQCIHVFQTDTRNLDVIYLVDVLDNKCDILATFCIAIQIS